MRVFRRDATYAPAPIHLIPGRTTPATPPSFSDPRLRSPDRRHRIWPRTDSADPQAHLHAAARTGRPRNDQADAGRRAAVPWYWVGQAQAILRVGDQKGNAQAVMEAEGVLKDVPYRIAWKEFVAAAPLLETLCAGAIKTGLQGHMVVTEVEISPGRRVPFSALSFLNGKPRKRPGFGLGLLLWGWTALFHDEHFRPGGLRQ